MTDPVVVVGAGPTGLVAALLLARRGVAVTVLERRSGVHPLPRAVHLDDESVRILQAAGVASGFAAISRAAAGLRLVDARLRPFAEFRRSGRGVHGWPESNLFDQPDLEALLRDRAAADPLVDLREGAEVVGVTGAGRSGAVRDEFPGSAGVGAGGQIVGEDHVGAVGVRLASGERVPASAVLGCDGAHSVVRESLGARMRDLGFTERWFVVDVRAPHARSGWGGVDQVCDPARAATFVDLPGDRYRWEFRMHAGDDASSLAARVPELVARWSPGPVDVLRAGEYTFAARVADRWSDGRVFLLGDAAHLTPPFIGQGLGAGLRDAHNLAWKLAADLYDESAPMAVRREVPVARPARSGARGVWPGWWARGVRPGSRRSPGVRPAWRAVPGVRPVWWTARGVRPAWRAVPGVRPAWWRARGSDAADRAGPDLRSGRSNPAAEWREPVLAARTAEPGQPAGMAADYPAERGPHVEAMIRGAVRVGRAMTGGPGAVAVLRRPVVAGALRIPAVRRRAAAGLSTRFGPGALVDRRRHRRDPVGTICPQPWPGHDALLGDGWSLLAGSAPIPPDLARRAADLHARTVRTAEPILLRWLAETRTAAVLLRPDRIVAATAPI